MPFDLSSAQPVVAPKKGFDLKSAKPVSASAKDETPSESLNAIGGISEPSNPEEFKLDSPPFGVLYNMLRGANTSDDALNNAQMMGFEVKPLSDGKSFVIERGKEKFRYDPESMFTGFVGSIRPTAQTAGSMAGGVLGAEAGPAGVMAGGAAGGTAGGQLADLAVGAFTPRGTTFQQEAVQGGKDALQNTEAALLGDIAGRGINAGARGISNFVEKRGADKAIAAAKTEVPTEKTYQELVDQLKTGKTKKLLPKIMPNLELKRAAEQEGIDLNPSHYSTNQAYVEVEQALKSRPGSLLNTREQNAILRMGQVADEIKTNLGAMGDKSQLNADYTAKVFDTIDAIKAQESPLYQKVADAIPKQTKVNPKNTLSFLQQRIDDLGGAEYLTPEERKVFARFEGGKVNHALLDETRKQIGEGYNKQGPFKDASSRLLDGLYGAMTKDQEGVAKVFGLDTEYELAKKLTQQRKFIEQSVEGLYGSKAVEGAKSGFDLQLSARLDGAVSKLTQGNMADFRKTIQLVPKDMRQEAVGNSLDALFTSGSRNKNNSIGQGFISAYEGLNKNAAAKSELFQYIPKVEQERIDNLYQVAKGVYGAKRWENTSGTARAMLAAMDKDPGVLTKLWQVGKAAGVTEAASSSMGAPGVGTAVTIASTVMGAKKSAATKAADELVASPMFEAALTKYARGENTQQFLGSKAYQNWVKAQPEPIAARVASMGFFAWLFAQPTEPQQPVIEPLGQQQGQEQP
jgi:hypothetical protein